MQHLSTQVANKQRITRTVNTAVTANLERLAQGLGALLFPEGVPEDVNLVKLMAALAGLLQRDIDSLAELDRLVSRERHEDQDARDGRDGLAGALRGRWLGLRGVVENGFGAQAAVACGLSGQVPDSPEALVQVALNAADKLPALAGKPSLTPYLSFDAAAAAADLKAKALEMQAALELVGTEKRETQNAQNQRAQAHGSWDGHYDPVAGIVERLFLLIQDAHIAARVRPTNRRRAGTPEPEDLEAGAGAGDAGGTGDGTGAGADDGTGGTAPGGALPIILPPPSI